jgi:xanthine dehydrogenase FAD-binding subunit
VRISEIYNPSSAAETVNLLRDIPDILLLAGGSEIVGSQTSRVIDFPAQVASISKVLELKKTFRTEQFLEIGSCTTLTGLLTLSPGTLPEPLPKIIVSIANHAVQNVATIGGNLCSKHRFMDLWPFLSCMDAQIELRSSTGTRWASLSHLCDETGSPAFPKATLLSRIRIPLFSYNFVFCRKLGSSVFPGPETAYFVCMANLGHGKIDDFRLAFAGEKAFRLKENEMAIAGKKTTSGQREVRSLIESYLDAFPAEGFYDRRIFLALLEEAFGRLFE